MKRLPGLKPGMRNQLLRLRWLVNTLAGPTVMAYEVVEHLRAGLTHNPFQGQPVSARLTCSVRRFLFYEARANVAEHAIARQPSLDFTNGLEIGHLRISQRENSDEYRYVI